MARDRANIRIDMWADDDFRALSVDAQHVYMLLLTHPTMNYVGVADWRPKRLAALSGGNTAARVEAAAAELAAGAFVYVDEDTEEVFVRSFVKHDGLLKHPRLHVTMANDFAGVASRPIREFFAHELRKMHAAEPGFACWDDKRLRAILALPGRDLKAEVGVSGDAPDVPAMASAMPKESNSSDMRTATATATKNVKVADAPVLSTDPDEFLISEEAALKGEAPKLDGFQAFWDEYRTSSNELTGGKPGSKPKAQAAYVKLRKTLSAEQIMALCRAYFEGKRRDKSADSRGFVPSAPHAVRWLGEGLWSDYDLDPATVLSGAHAASPAVSADSPSALTRAQVTSILGPDSMREPSPPAELVGDFEGQDAWLAQWRRERFAQRQQEAWTTARAAR